MKQKGLMKKLSAVLFAIIMIVSTCSQFSASVFAQKKATSLFQYKASHEINDEVIVNIMNVSKPDDEIYQGNNTRVTFDFEIVKKNIGDAFYRDEKIEIETNIGDLFDANWSDFSNIEIKDDNNTLLATVSFTEKKIIFVIKDRAVDSNTLSGQVISVEKLTAKDVGAIKDKDVKKEFIIGNVKKDITFKYLNQNPITPSDKNPVDIDTSWKNAWSNNSKTGATTSIEVNPIGSMDLYGFYTYPQNQKPNRNPQITSYDNFLVKDIIQDQGYIDKNSIKIYAAVPDIGVKNVNTTYNGWYKVPAGTYYAARQGTIRYRIDKNTVEDFGRERLTYLTQNPDETYDQFYNRIISKPLQWGIYYSSEANTETFLCNFGGIGHKDPIKNNGIKYSDYGIQDRGEALGDKNFLLDTGPTAGNIVSYYIEYNSYYPDVEGVKNVDNSVECYDVTPTNTKKIGGNKATFEINNGSGFGTIRKNELSLLLVDEEDNSKPISNARFKIQQKVGDKWIDIKIEKITDSEGRIKIKNFPTGTYKIVQLSTANGYIFDNNSYKESSNSLLQKVSQNGEFTISDDKSFGVGTIVTNEKKKYYSVKYEFKSKNGETLPFEVISLLPQDINRYYEGDTISAIKLLETEVVVSNGIWVFKGYDANDKVVDADIADVDRNIRFIGTWEFKKNASIVNIVPTISASDKTLTVGDEFDPLKDVTAKDKEDGDIALTIDNVIKNDVNTSKAGVYEVTYKVTDSQGASTIKTIYVTVNLKMEGLNQIPVINAEDKTIYVGDEFDPLNGVTSIDKEDGDITKDIEILNNDVNTNKAGVYEVIYKVTDSQGASTVKTIKVTVKVKDIPVVPGELDKPNKPDDTNKPIIPNTSVNDKTPETGDHTNVILWTVLLFVSGLTILSVTRKQKK